MPCQLWHIVTYFPHSCTTHKAIKTSRCMCCVQHCDNFTLTHPTVPHVTKFKLLSTAAGTPPIDAVSIQQPGIPSARPGTQGLGPQASVQSSDNIHIQLEPLQGMDSYAAKLMCPGMEVAIYSGRCPLGSLAAFQPPRALQQQVRPAMHCTSPQCLACKCLDERRSSVCCHAALHNSSLCPAEQQW